MRAREILLVGDVIPHPDLFTFVFEDFIAKLNYSLAIVYSKPVLKKRHERGSGLRFTSIYILADAAAQYVTQTSWYVRWGPRCRASG